MPVKKRTGKASYFRVQGTLWTITKYGPKVKRGLAGTSDSANYDAGTDMVHLSQEPFSLQTELSVEGYLDFNSYDANIMALLYSGIEAVPVVLGLDAGAIFGHGNFDISEFDADVPILETVSFTCTMMSNGVFVHGS